MSTFAQRVAAATDNAYRWPGNFHNFYTGGIEIGRPNDTGDPHENAYLRWQNVTIPAGSTIDSASVSLSRWYTGTLALQLRIQGLDEDNTNAFSTEGDATGRTLTDAYVDWNPSSSWTENVDQTSGDIKSIIQEIVNRGSWASGNALGLRIADLNSALYSYGPFNYATYYGSYAPLLTINYTPPAHLITKDLKYSIVKPIAITKSLKYEIDLITNTPKTFCGVKIAKAGINVLNTNDPRHLKVSSDYNTLKYYWDGTAQIHVQNPPKNEYTVVGYVTHDLGYFPLAMVYAKDDLLSDYQPLGHYQAGSGAYRQFYYYVTTTRLYFVVEGWSESGDDNYLVDFYFKIFKNNLNL